MSTEAKTVWVRVDGKRPTRRPVLVGQQISLDWLSGTVNLTQIRLVGHLRRLFGDLISAAKDAKLNLPVVSLRTALICRMDNVVTLDKDLGLVPGTTSGYPSAIELFSPADEDLPAVREHVAQVIKRWILDDVEIWAEKKSLGPLVGRLRESISPAAIELASVQVPYRDERGQTNFQLIARSIGERLIGEELFEGVGNCELVASPEHRSNFVELMTQPRRGVRDEVYSMVARLTVSSLPYSKELYLVVSALKRVWAKRPPTAAFGTPASVTGYVVAVGRPVAKVTVARTRDGWEFGEEYATLRRESADQLPSTLSEAIAQRGFNPDTGWWSGLPELPSLFRAIAPRTVFESDEISLLERIGSLLDPIVSRKPILLREIKLPRFQAKPRQEMLRLSDFGVAGAAFNANKEGEGQIEDEEEDEDVDDTAQSGDTREEKLHLYREQNIEALKRAHGQSMPILWMLGGTATEQELTRRTIGILFGDTIQVNTEALPTYTHGLRADLDHPDYTARKRFDERLKRWQRATETIKSISGDRHIVVLICAPDRVGTKSEDPVNYFAGIHAMSVIGANVHHVLPIENPDDPKSTQAFLHRVQSALLDVMLAHTGVVFGVNDFVRRLLPSGNIPQAIYGIQALRARARSRSGQVGLNFVLYSRILVDTGITEVRIGYRDGTRNQLTTWMTLAKALAWTGSQRRLQDGDTNWLKNAFPDLTRTALTDIAASDPKAIVLIEWDSMRSLWRGISDADLALGNPPRLQSSNLTQYKGMTFVRLRQGADTLPLRTLVRTTFKGWKLTDGVLSDTGELKPDTYVTTDMRLVEVSTDLTPEGRPFGHYIASMGYTKTVQVKRGFSSYRSMPRMCRIAKGLGEFEQKMLDIAPLDASLPASMDVSVMSTPEAVEPTRYAILAMGLRLGYAHYNDWTRLPMPLFFRRKIEDYVIRYPDDVEAFEVAVAESSDETANPTVYSELVVQQAGGVLEEGPRQTTPDVLGAPPQDEGADLLSRAKATPMPILWAHQDYHARRFYQRVLTGDIHVHVELPYWVRTRGIFTLTADVTKRLVRRSWDRMIDFGYVKSGIRMPPVDDYIDWLAAKLRIPQVSSTIVSVTREIGQINFTELVEAIERDFNSSVSREESVAPFAIDDEMLVRLTKWADTHRNDELLGWLVFMVSQLPYPDRGQLLLKNMTGVPGPRTSHALEYYLATASAANAILEQKHNLRPLAVVRDLPMPKTRESATPSSLSVHTPSPHPRIEVIEERSAPEGATSMPDQAADLLGTTKGSLVELIGGIEPGTQNFDEKLAEIGTLIDRLSQIHLERSTLQAAAAAIAERMSRLRERQQTVAGTIMSMRDVLEIGRIEVREVQPDDIEIASDEVSKIDEAIATLSALLRQLDELERTPIPAASLQERKKRKDTEQLIAENAYARAEAIRALLQQNLCFQIETPTPPPQGEDKSDPTPTIPTTPIPAIHTSEPDTQEPVATCLDTESTLPADHGVVAVSTSATEPAPIVQVSPSPPVPTAPLPEASTPVESQRTPLDGTQNTLLASALERQIPTLQVLIRRRLYGLAEIHVAAIGNILEGVDDKELQVHESILTALIAAVDSMDCRFSFDLKLNARLAEFLTAERLPSGEIADPAHVALGVLAAGLANMLFDDSTVQWRIGNALSACLGDYAALSALIDHVDIIRQRGFALSRDLFVRSRIGDKNALEQEMARLQKRAENWKHAPEIHSTFNHRGFVALHNELFSPKNPIGKCLAVIARGDISQAASAYEEAQRRFEKPAQTVEELYKRIGERTKPTGLYRIQVVENIETTQRFVLTYLDLAVRRNSQDPDLNRDLQAFLNGLNHKLTEAIQEARQIECRTDLEVLYRDSAVKAMQCAARLFDTHEPAACIPDIKQRLLIQWPIGKDLMPVMRRLDNLTPALCTPDDVFDQTRRLAEEPLTLGDPSSDDDIDQALADAYQGHVAAKRFLPAFLIEPMLTRSHLPKGQTLLQQHTKELAVLVAELQEARQKVAHAMTLSALPQEDTNRMQWLIEELLMLCRHERPIGKPNAESSAYPDFPQARAALRCNVLQPLESRLSEANARLETELQEEENKGLVSGSDIARIRNMLESSNAATLRTARDALNMLRQSGRLPARIKGGHNLADEYDLFVEDLRKSTGCNRHILDALKEKLSAQGQSGDEPEWLARLEPEQRAEALELINAWTGFFTVRNSADQDATERLFRALGFTTAPVPYRENARAARARFVIDEQAFRFPTTPDDPMFIPPILGSWATHTECYALFGVVQENDIRQLMQEVGSVPTLVLARTHLNMHKRAKIVGNSPALLVDDDLLAYAALHPGERLQCLIKVGILTFTTNPYDDYNTRPVPREMFFGRKEELDRLRAVKGLAVLYGGRRLGKSSLLNQIEQESSKTPGQEAVYVSMDTVNTTGDYVLSAWEFIYRALTNRKIIAPLSPLPTQWKLILQHVERQLIDGSKAKSLFLLLDEADNLMGCELRRKRDEDSFVRSLTQLSDNVAGTCQVRMVITGLHNVTRMANDENSVFGKAEPIPLKPFSSADDVQRGIRLITKPLAAMGYLFGPDADDLPLRILSVCNFYPAFVQLYCKRLVEHLQNNRQDKKPPFMITERALDIVEKDSNLMSELREKFKLNLNLDKRYKAIALILADVYYTEIEGGQYSGLTTPEIQEHCEAYCPRHFDNTSVGVYESLLDEMSKLNVVEKIGTRYVLRNPNIAMMVGDRERILAMINELAIEPPEAARNHGERRILLTKNNAHMVFPMPMSWVRSHMDATDGELLILTGNILSGIMDLARLERDEWQLQDGVFVSVPGNSPQNLADQVARSRRISPDHRRPKIMAVRNTAWRVDQISDYATIAYKAAKSGIRIILLAHPERSLEITSALESGKLKSDPDAQRPWRVVPIPPWSEDAIFFWVHENVRVAESPEAIAAIRSATGGFGKEILELCTPNLSLEAALELPKTRQSVLAPSLATFYENIGIPPALIAERGEAIQSFLELTDGVDRTSCAEIEENMHEYAISEHLVHFLNWMGLLQEGPQRTWSLPLQYANLLR